jgi:hypothetical protein
MGRLSEILRNGDEDDLRRAWHETQSAGEYEPLPRGDYVAIVRSGQCIQSRTNGTPGYRITFEVSEGEYHGRLFWHEVWLTQKAMGYAKRDLEKLGIHSIDALDKPMRAGMVVTAHVVLRSNDFGAEYNQVRSFRVQRVDGSEADPFYKGEEGVGRE